MDDKGMDIKRFICCDLSCDHNFNHVLNKLNSKYPEFTILRHKRGQHYRFSKDNIGQIEQRFLNIFKEEQEVQSKINSMISVGIPLFWMQSLENILKIKFSKNLWDNAIQAFQKFDTVLVPTMNIKKHFEKLEYKETTTLLYTHILPHQHIESINEVTNIL